MSTGVKRKKQQKPGPANAPATQQVPAKDVPAVQTIPTENVPAATGVKARCRSLRHKAQAVVTNLAPGMFSPKGATPSTSKSEQ